MAEVSGPSGTDRQLRTQNHFCLNFQVIQIFPEEDVDPKAEWCILNFDVSCWINKPGNRSVWLDGGRLPWLPERALLPDSLPALGHQLQHGVERRFVVVEDDHVLAGVRQLRHGDGVRRSPWKHGHSATAARRLTSVMIMSWHFLTYLPSALMMVCRKLRYWTWRPCVARQWMKCCSTLSEISLHSW